MGTVTGQAVAQAFGGLVIEADQAVLTGEFADHVAACLRAALSSGIAGWRDDDLAFTRDWGFSLTRGAAAARRHLAGRPGPDGPVRARPVAGRQHSAAPART